MSYIRAHAVASGGVVLPHAGLTLRREDEALLVDGGPLRHAGEVRLAEGQLTLDDVAACGVERDARKHAFAHALGTAENALVDIVQ
jgi:hypothetical protein